MSEKGCVKREWCIAEHGAVKEGCPYAPFALDGLKKKEKKRPRKNRYRLPPNPLAEDVCLPALQEEEPRNYNDSYKCHSTEMVSDLEQALAHFDPQEKEWLLDESKEHCRRVIDTKDIFDSGKIERYIEARKVWAWMPMFEARVHEVEPSEQDMLMTHINIVNLLHTYDDDVMQKSRKLHKKDAKQQLALHHRTELEIAGLLSRVRTPNLFPYPAFAREEANGKYSSFNHDIYTIYDGKKVPIQIKSTRCNRDYDDEVRVIVHHDICNRAHAAPQLGKSAVFDEIDNGTEYVVPPKVMRQLFEMCDKPSITELLVMELKQGTCMESKHRLLLNSMLMNVMSDLKIDEVQAA